MSINKGMEKQKMVCPYNAKLFSLKKKQVLSPVITRMNLEKYDAK